MQIKMPEIKLKMIKFAFHPKNSPINPPKTGEIAGDKDMVIPKREMILDDSSFSYESPTMARAKTQAHPEPIPCKRRAPMSVQMSAAREQMILPKKKMIIPPSIILLRP